MLFCFVVRVVWAKQPVPVSLLKRSTGTRKKISENFIRETSPTIVGRKSNNPAEGGRYNTPHLDAEFLFPKLPSGFIPVIRNS